MPYDKLINFFEEVTKSVWINLEYAHNSNLSFGETTISDVILLNILKSNNPNIFIRQTKQHEESDFGTDWVWWIGSSKLGWVCFAVQAKKFYTNDNSYKTINHQVLVNNAKTSQSLILEAHASAIGAVPIYALYNYVLDKDFDLGSQHLNYSTDRYGVTVTSLNTIKKAIKTYGGRKFKSLHDNPSTFPLPDLIKLTKTFLNQNNTNGYKYSELLNSNTKIHQELPKNLGLMPKSGLVLMNRDLKFEQPTFAKRALVINLDKD